MALISAFYQWLFSDSSYKALRQGHLKALLGTSANENLFYFLKLIGFLYK